MLHKADLLPTMLYSCLAHIHMSAHKISVATKIAERTQPTAEGYVTDGLALQQEENGQEVVPLSMLSFYPEEWPWPPYNGLVR